MQVREWKFWEGLKRLGSFPPLSITTCCSLPLVSLQITHPSDLYPGGTCSANSHVSLSKHPRLPPSTHG